MGKSRIPGRNCASPTIPDRVAAGDLVDLPSHGDGLHFYRGDDQEARDLKKRKVGMGEGDGSGLGVGGRDMDF